MDKQIFTDETIRILRRHLRKHRDREERPILIFSCGGEEGLHPSRRLLREYVEHSATPSLKNVFFMKAENIASNPSMKGFDLLTQEALVADIADWLVIFAESVGSFCELGAFAALPHSASITSVVVDRRYKNSSSFLMNGPVKVIENCKAPLAKVFFANLQCPMECSEFASFVTCVRETVKQSERVYDYQRGRKTINTERSSILVGSFALELLDLVSLFGPVSEAELVELYCILKGFDAKPLRLVSPILEKDMGSGKTIRPSQIVAVMLATEMLGKVEFDSNGSPLYYSKVPIENYFMFKDTQDRDFRDARAQVLLRRRSRRRHHEKNLYGRFN